MAKRVRVTFKPVTSEHWSALSELFGSRGACGGCWCMTPRLTRAEYERGKGAANRRALRRLVDAGSEPGLLGFVGERPAVWVSVGPREDFAQLANSRILAPVDEAPVWSIVCLFVRRDQRGAGLSVAALRAAVDHARARGATCVEGYPVEPKTKPMPAVFAYTGLSSAFERAGFREVARRSATRPIMRRRLRARRASHHDG